tara:strand:+ start:77 stop:454 length:378 start_codon:yes stop_codon:yes gene_type:complete
MEFDMSAKSFVEMSLREKGLDLKLSWRIRMFKLMREQLEERLEVVLRIIGELEEKSREVMVLECGRELKVGDVSELSDDDLKLLEQHILNNKLHSESEDLFMNVGDELRYREYEALECIEEELSK